jgi:hypothetical protein
MAGCMPSNAAREPTRAAAAVSAIDLQLAPGQRLALPGGGALRYVALASDSRCPRDVQCIHAGEAVLRFELEADNRVHPFELATVPPRDAAAIGGRRIRLLEVTRDDVPRARLAIDPAD